MCPPARWGRAPPYPMARARAFRLDKKDNRVYCVLGDGEMDEGQVWEAAMTASFRHLGNLCAILDRNGLQQDGETRLIKDLEPVAEKWRGGGWGGVGGGGDDPRPPLGGYDPG